jgi:hypothetical protein
MSNDRTYFRRLSDHELIDVTRYGDNELALVLAERLDILLNVEEQLDRAKEEIVELNAQLYEWKTEANNLQARLDATENTSFI